MVNIVYFIILYVTVTWKGGGAYSIYTELGQILSESVVGLLLVYLVHDTISTILYNFDLLLTFRLKKSQSI